MNGTATHQWTTAYDTSHRSSVKDKLSKNHSGPTYLETPKDVATKSGETRVRDRALPSRKFYRRSARDICPRAKKYIFFLIRIPLEASVPCYTFLESSCRANVSLHLTCNAATLGFWCPLGVYPKGEKTCPGHIPSCKMQIFTPIGGICNKISVPRHTQKYKELHQIYRTKRILALRL